MKHLSPIVLTAIFLLIISLSSAKDKHHRETKEAHSVGELQKKSYTQSVVDSTETTLAKWTVSDERMKKALNFQKGLELRDLGRYCRNKLQRLPHLNKRLTRLTEKGKIQRADYVTGIIENKNKKMPLLMDVIKARGNVVREQENYLQDKSNLNNLKTAILELKQKRANYNERKETEENENDIGRCERLRITHHSFENPL